MPEAPRTVDAFVLEIAGCTTPEALFAAYGEEMKAEGYDNFIFARMGPGEDLAPREVPFVHAPESLTTAYLQNRMWEHDPILTASQHAAVPFTWIDLMTRQSHSDNARRVMDARREHSVQGGFTMPFQGPHGFWDAVNVSMRDKKFLNPDRLPIVNLKTYAMLQRYIILTMGNNATGPWTGLSSATCEHDGLLRQHPQHGEGVGLIDDPECWAIALVDIAARRYAAGLLDLNRRVPEIVGEDILARFMKRGLIQEDPDDFRFHFVFRPSPVGQSHLKQCPCVSQWRDEVWSRYVRKNERPED